MKLFKQNKAAASIFGLLFAFLILSANIFAQPQANAASPKITVIDEKGLADLIKPKGKPLLINFWATWCVPCREEFPDLVILDGEYKGKIDFVTISLDFEEELETGVPKFLSSMKAEMPAYLLLTADEDAAISSVSKEWRGGLPFTILFAADGTTAYHHQGLIKLDTVRPIIDGLLKQEN